MRNELSFALNSSCLLAHLAFYLCILLPQPCLVSMPHTTYPRCHPFSGIRQKYKRDSKHERFSCAKDKVATGQRQQRRGATAEAAAAATK